MANWNLPDTSSNYLDYPTYANARDVDAITLAYGSPTNLPNHAIRYNRSTNIFEEWDTAVWNGKVLEVAGGGTGGATASAARTALGIGSMGVQNSNSVTITGGAISGVTMAASVITSGTIALARGGTGASLSLGTAGQVLYSTGAAVAFADGDQIAKLNASNLTSGTVPSARLTGTAILANSQTFTGVNVFAPSPDTLANMPLFSGAIPAFHFQETDQAANAKITTIAVEGGTLFIQSRTDAFGLTATLMTITRGGVIGGNGSSLTSLNASNLASGTVATARLGSGTADSTVFLRGDGTWAAPGSTPPVPSGMIAMFTTACPTGWTRVTALDNRFPRGSSSYGAIGGTDTHRHGQSGTTSSDGAHTHTLTTGNPDNVQTGIAAGPDYSAAAATHTHSGTSSSNGAHTHSITNDTSDTTTLPPYVDVVWCSKD